MAPNQIQPLVQGATKCTAIILPLKERRARACGKPAIGHNAMGLPRCRHHMKKVVMP